MGESNQDVREIRLNPIVPSESVLVATARNMRPKQKEEPAPRDNRQHVEQCPFCTGNEHKTPPLLYAFPDEQNWQVRIVENLYPVLGDGDSGQNFAFGLQQAIDGYGRHEVIIDHNHHGICVHEMSESHLAALFCVYRDRMKVLYDADQRLRYVLVFKNYGPAAGASMAHTHSQIIATPVIPNNIQAELENSHQYYDAHRHCIFCTLINEALTYEATIYDKDSGEVSRKIDVGQYVVERSEKFIAIKPFASKYEWEVHILPLSHEADFLKLNDGDAQDFARVLNRTMKRLEVVIGGAQYNYFLHSLPHTEIDAEYKDSYHWHLEICPRTSIPAGFELGSGLFVNTISPEDAARQLREVELD